MKAIFTIFLLTLSFFSYSQNGQEEPIYADVNIGFLPVDDDFMHGFNFSMGYEFTPNWGLGLSINQVGVLRISGSRSMFGLSIEPRFEYKRLLVTLNGGFLLNAKINDAYCVGKKTKAADLYLRPSIAYRMGTFSLGLSAMIAPNLHYNMEELDEENPSGFCNTTEPYAQSNYDSRYIFVTLGLSFPKIKRSK